MSDSIFLDTNILVYAYSNTEVDKQTIARKLMAESTSYISTQVLQELSNILTKKFGASWQQVLDVLYEMVNNNRLHTNTNTTIFSACQIADKYHFSFYDSLIIAAASECSCAILYSEDLQHEQVIETKLKIINPFR